MCDRRQLMPHQRRAYRWARPRANIPLFMDLRLGKTLVAIRWAERFSGRVLIVCPLSVAWVWRESLLEQGHRSTILHASSREKRDELLRRLPASRRWCIVNWEGLTHRGKGTRKAQPSPVAMDDWETVILDESYRIHNPKANVTRVVNSHLRNTAKHRAILTGLPDPESELDYFEQFRFVYGSFLGCTSFWTFRHRYFQQYGFQWIPRRGVTEQISSSVKDLSYRLQWDEVFGKKKRSDRDIELVRHIELPAPARKAYRETETMFACAGMETKWSVVVDGWLRQITGGRPKQDSLPNHDAKLRELVSLLTGELRNVPTIVWFQFTNEGRAIENAIYEAGITTRRISGATPRRLRENYCFRFDRGEIQNLCLQTATSRYGLDYSHANVMIYYSEPVSNDQYTQSRQRMRHPKKKTQLTVITLVCRDTVDEHIHTSLLKKRIRSAFVLDDVARKLRQEWDKKYAA